MEAERAEPHHDYELIVNRKEYKWPREQITGAEIKKLAGSPDDWIVNEIVGGPGEDPEIGNDQHVDLSPDTPPKGIKRFITRKPKTNPGSR
jgi:multiubiquitin